MAVEKHLFKLTAGMFGRMSEIEMDGVVLKNVTRVNVEVSVHELTKVTIEYVADVEIIGEVYDTELEIKDPKV
jgi:hypothetical protein